MENEEKKYLVLQGYEVNFSSLESAKKDAANDAIRYHEPRYIVEVKTVAKISPITKIEWVL
jgi:hypothetical protein